jgi:HSP20 family protein
LDERSRSDGIAPDVDELPSGRHVAGRSFTMEVTMSTTKLQRTQGTPTRYTPFGSSLSREMNEMRDRMRRLMQQPFGRIGPEAFPGDMLQAVGWLPAVEISESDTEFTVVAELPGMKAKDVQVEFVDGVLTLRGEKQEQRDERERRYHLWERSYGTFLRTFEFPVAIDEEKLHAEHRDGLLEVHLPKKVGTAPQGRRIEVTDKA